MAQTLKPVSIVDAVYEALRERILTGQLGPAEVLHEQATAELYGVARPTAKAAIDRLVTTGLLRRIPNRSARVPQLTEDDVRDLYFSRRMIEVPAVRFLATEHLSPDKSKRALLDFDIAAESQSVQGMIDADIAFHQALIETVGSPRTTRMYASIIGEAHLCMILKQTHHLHSPVAIAHDHWAIYEAIATGDAMLAENKMIEHLDHSEHAIRSLFHDDTAGQQSASTLTSS